MTATTPAPFPNNGLRTLSPKETLQRLKAASCVLPKSSAPRCAGQVFVGIFFDGTGNNMKIDYDDLPPEQRKHSNVVRLFHCYRYAPADGYIPFYVPGVGTPFPEIGDGGGARGSAVAYKGEDRIAWAFTQLVNAPHIYVTGAPLIEDSRAANIARNLASSGTPPAMRRVVLNTWQDNLAAALKGRKPEVTLINLSVFGFSRGAAQARAFVNWLFEVCKEEGGSWKFADIPIRLDFLGIFDTVASVGLTNLLENEILAGHQSWADNNLQIHPAVEQCIHYVAGHEVRACFPLDSARIKAAYPGNAREVMYPGAHSDVGGGYPPSALGVSTTVDDFMAIIPGVTMYHDARKAGVPLLPWNELRPAVQKSLMPSKEAIATFNAYLVDAGVRVGSVEQMHRRHMSLYFSYRFKHRHNFFSRRPYTTAPSQHQSHLKKTQNSFIKRLASLGHGNPMDPDFDPPTISKLHQSMLKAAGLQPTIAEQLIMEVAEGIDVKAVTPAMEKLFDGYLHDSMAGFIDMGMDEYALNKIGIGKFRTIFSGDD